MGSGFVALMCTGLALKPRSLPICRGICGGSAPLRFVIAIRTLVSFMLSVTAVLISSHSLRLLVCFFERIQVPDKGLLGCMLYS